MGSFKYILLDYQNQKLTKPLSSDQMVATIEALHSNYTNSWDVLCKNTQKIVTFEFVEREGKWKHEPQPEARQCI
jgi:hypothetical protein